jgi:hypothetical protein
MPYQQRKHDLTVSDDHGIQYNELSTRDGHCVLGKRLS